jgi:hypothetical protein
LCKFLYPFVLVLLVSNFLGFVCLVCCASEICLDFTLHLLFYEFFLFLPFISCLFYFIYYYENGL